MTRYWPLAVFVELKLLPRAHPRKYRRHDGITQFVTSHSWEASRELPSGACRSAGGFLANMR
jgi:hypothetical protein